MSTTIHAQSGHTLFVKPIPREELPAGLASSEAYERFWVVKNWDDSGVVFFYLGRGHKQAPNQVVVWYRGGAFYSGFGKTLKEAIDNAQRDGWMYA